MGRLVTTVLMSVALGSTSGACSDDGAADPPVEATAPRPSAAPTSAGTSGSSDDSLGRAP